MDNQLRAGGVVVKDIKLITASNDELSLHNIFTEVQIIEDMNKSMMYGKVGILEYSNFVQALPIVGEEFVQITYALSADEDAPERSLEFRVTKVNSLTRPNDKSFSYELIIISPEYYNGVQRSIDASISSKVEKMVEQFIKDDLGSKKTLAFEETKSIQNILFPSMSVIDSIKYCSFRAQSLDNYDSNYKFYETSEGFNFISVGKLAEQESVVDITYHQVTQNEIGEVDKASFNAISFEVIEKNDTASMTYNGGYRNSVLCFDPLLKKYVYKEKNYFKDDKKLAKVETNKSNTPLFEDVVANDGALEYAFITNLRDKPRENSVDATDMYVPGYEDFYIDRQMSRVHISNIVLAITIPITTRLKVGDVINFSVPKDDSTARASENDRYISGRYLITKLSNLFTQDRGVTNLEVRKSGSHNVIEREV